MLAGSVNNNSWIRSSRIEENPVRSDYSASSNLVANSNGRQICLTGLDNPIERNIVSGLHLCRRKFLDGLWFIKGSKRKFILKDVSRFRIR